MRDKGWLFLLITFNIPVTRKNDMPKVICLLNDGKSVFDINLLSSGSGGEQSGHGLINRTGISQPANHQHQKELNLHVVTSRVMEKEERGGGSTDGKR